MSYPKPVRRKRTLQTTLAPAERRKLYERTGGLCEWCSGPMDYEDMADHHRRPRSAGGGWELSNQLGTHHHCHNVQPGSIHQNPQQGRVRGAIVSRYGAEPREVPVIIHRKYWLLNDDGTKTQMEHPF